MSAPAAGNELARLADFRAKSPNILFIIERSKNLNVVVYEAMVGADKALDATKPVDVYWLDVDPEYIKANRAKGVMTDRSDLNVFESQFAYGLSTTAAAKAGEFLLKLVALPKQVITVFIDAATGRVRARTTISGRECDLEKVFVQAEERFMRTPKVIYVDIFGIDLANSELVRQRLSPDEL